MVTAKMPGVNTPCRNRQKSSAGKPSAVAAAKDGDVIIAHINQPSRPAGAGVVQGILKLKENGFSFVRLDDGS